MIGTSKKYIFLHNLLVTYLVTFPEDFMGFAKLYYKWK